jgi:hypothetical protein
MVDCGSEQGRRVFETTGVAALRRGMQKHENAAPRRKMPFMERHYPVNWINAPVTTMLINDAGISTFQPRAMS